MADSLSLLTAEEQELVKRQEEVLDQLRAVHLSRIILANHARQRLNNSPELVAKFEELNKTKYDDFIRTFPIPPADGRDFNLFELGAFYALVDFEEECRAKEIAEMHLNANK